MAYPPEWRRETDSAELVRLVGEYPFAQLFTAHNGLRSTPTPMLLDCEAGRPARLRGHLNRRNPQVDGLDGAQILAVFSGPSTYVSPNWRTDLARAGTFDYEEVRIEGKASLVSDLAFFTDLIDQLAAQIEPQYSEVGDYPVWQTSMTPEGYVEKLFPHIQAFTIAIEKTDMISKLHQAFSAEDRASIADHLSRSHRSDARAIAKRMRTVRR